MSTAATSKVLEAALEYAALGWRVVALYGVNKDGVCTCYEGVNCRPKSRGKHPCLGNDWQTKATTDDLVIEEWFRLWPLANIGIQLGPISGLIDIEFDNDRGKATAAKLFAEGCFTPTYRSGRSIHRLFKWRDDFPQVQKISDWQGLEIRLGGGNKGTQSVAPPSTHWSGVQYEWLTGLSPSDVEPTDVPFEVLSYLRTVDDGTAAYAKRVNTAAEPSLNGSGKPKEHWDELLAGVPEGKRNDAITSLAGKMLRSISDLDDESAVQATLTAVLLLNLQNKPPLVEKEVRTTFGSILKREKQRRASEEAAPNFRKPAEQLVAEDRAVGVEGWRLEIVNSDPPSFRIYSPLWKDRAPNGFIVLSKEHLTSAIRIKQEAAAQAHYPLPVNFKKIWEGTSKQPGLFERLMFSAEVVDAPLEEKRGLVVAEWTHAKLSRATPAEHPDHRGRPTKLPCGAIAFSFNQVWQDMSMSADRVTRTELSKVLREIGVKRKSFRLSSGVATLKIADMECLEKLRTLIGISEVVG